MRPVVVLCNCKPEEAPSIARALVESRLVACVNIIPNVRSFYIWEEQLCDDQESTLIIKTFYEMIEQLKLLILEIHTYEVPEIITLDTIDVLASYKEWMNLSIKDVNI
jgi:periplasmic divalent cation tolerance protein